MRFHDPKASAKDINGHIATLNAQRESVSVPQDTSQPLEQGSPFAVLNIDLSDSQLATGKYFPVPGFALIYARDGSNLAGRLDVDMGGRLTIAPGSRVQGKFSGFTLYSTTRSALSGTARLILLQSERANFIEPVVGGQTDQFSPTDLLGVASVPTFVTEAQSTRPTLAPASQNGAFYPTGFTRIRVLINADPAASGTPASSFDVIPWYYDASVGQWFEQGSEKVSVPDSSPTQYKWRVISLPVVGAGAMYLEIKNVASGATSLGLIVQGILA